MKKSEQEISAITLDKNDSDMFNAPKGYPAVVNSWYFYDFSNRLVLIDQERTIKPLKVLNNYQ
jgi:DNA-binding GntR family transcriptional regulator